MSKRDNFNQAMFDMFGVGKGGEKAAESAATAETEQQAVAQGQVTAQAAGAEVPAENVIPFSSGDGPELKVISHPPTYISTGTRVEGTLRAEGSVEIDGEFKGDIIAEGSVTIRTDVTGNITARSLIVVGCCLTGDARISELMTVDVNSSVNGNVSAGSLSSSGSIVGDLAIQHNVTLDESAKVVGNITSGTMTVARGAIIRGSVELRGDDRL